jgi:hypothetical protein
VLFVASCSHFYVWIFSQNSHLLLRQIKILSHILCLWGYFRNLTVILFLTLQWWKFDDLIRGVFPRGDQKKKNKKQKIESCMRFFLINCFLMAFQRRKSTDTLFKSFQSLNIPSTCEAHNKPFDS